MSATITILPTVQVLRFEDPCRRCKDIGILTFDQLTERERAHAPFGSVFPCPACFDRSAKIIPFKKARR